MIVEITGTEDKIDGLVEVLRPFGIIEMVRTGRVAMARGTRRSRADGGTPRVGNDRRRTSTDSNVVLIRV